MAIFFGKIFSWITKNYNLKTATASGKVSEQIIFDKGPFNRAIESPTDPLDTK